MSGYEKGEVYTGEIDRVSGQGNAIISVDEGPGHINLGEVDEESVGDVVEFEYKGGKRGEIVPRSMPAGPTDYDNKNDLLNGHL